MSRAEIMDWAMWVLETCLRMGATYETAFTVAGLFAQGLASEGSE